MMYIMEKHSEHFHTWSVGKSLPERIDVDEVQADGDELNYIMKNFTNIPFHNSKLVQSWTGDVAQFIVKHL